MAVYDVRCQTPSHRRYTIQLSISDEGEELSITGVDDGTRWSQIFVRKASSPRLPETRSPAFHTVNTETNTTETIAAVKKAVIPTTVSDDDEDIDDDPYTSDYLIPLTRALTKLRQLAVSPRGYDFKDVADIISKLARERKYEQMSIRNLSGRLLDPRAHRNEPDWRKDWSFDAQPPPGCYLPNEGDMKILKSYWDFNPRQIVSQPFLKTPDEIVTALKSVKSCPLDFWHELFGHVGLYEDGNTLEVAIQFDHGS